MMCGVSVACSKGLLTIFFSFANIPKRRITKLAAHISLEPPQNVVTENQRIQDDDDEDASLVPRRKPPSSPPSFGTTKQQAGGSKGVTIKEPKFSVRLAPVLGRRGIC